MARSSCSSLMSASRTCEPAEASAEAMPSPLPCAAPVTTETLPVRSTGSPSRERCRADLCAGPADCLARVLAEEHAIVRLPSDVHLCADGQGTALARAAGGQRIYGLAAGQLDP